MAPCRASQALVVCRQPGFRGCHVSPGGKGPTCLQVVLARTFVTPCVMAPICWLRCKELLCLAHQIFTVALLS